MLRPLCSLVLVLAAGCSSPPADPPTTASPEANPEAATPAAAPIPHEEGVAYFAGGCFWGVEHFLEALDGVADVESGYMGGTVESPSYEQVLTHTTGHLEAVRVRFDPAKVSYEQVTKLFFEIHDPTQEDGQGPDIGDQYLSAVFYTSPEQKKVTESLIGKLKTRGYDVVTQVRPATPFYAAEDYHQDYYERTGKTPYCHGRVDRFGDGS